MEDGRLMAWGRNQHGQLGNGSLTTQWSPVHVLDGVRTASAGADFSLALLESGDLMAWGKNSSGCLGDGDTSDRVRPVKVLSGVRAIAAGQDFSLALMEGEEGELRGWGNNDCGTLSHHLPPMQLLPTKLMEGVKSISAGGRHCMAFMKNRQCLSWGRNQHGQLGNGTAAKSHPGAHAVYDLWELAEHAGKLKVVVKEDAAAPANFGPESKGITRIGQAYHEDGRLQRGERDLHTIYNPDGSIRLWEKRQPKAPPASETSIRPWEQDVDWRTAGDLAAYTAHVERLDVDEEGGSLLPTLILENVALISAGGSHSLVTMESRKGGCLAFGGNTDGQLGDGAKETQLEPVTVMQQWRVEGVSAGWHHSLGVTQSGDCYAWGRNDSGQLGPGVAGQEGLRPMKVLAKVRCVAAGVDHSLALLESGSVAAWGSNSNGQIGNHTLTDALKPTFVFADAVAIAAGRCHSHALQRSGVCFSWGRNSHGQLGDASMQKKVSPVQVRGIQGATCLVSGVDHCLAVQRNGLCCAWGYNGNGRLGDGTQQMRDAPAGVLEGVRTASAGQYHSLAVLINGDCYAWGYNANGQLGDGTFEKRLHPVKMLEDVVAVAAGGAHSLAILSNGACLAWGMNRNGQCLPSMSRPHTAEDFMLGSDLGATDPGPALSGERRMSVASIDSEDGFGAEDGSETRSR